MRPVKDKPQFAALTVPLPTGSNLPLWPYHPGRPVPALSVSFEPDLYSYTSARSAAISFRQVSSSGQISFRNDRYHSVTGRKTMQSISRADDDAVILWLHFSSRFAPRLMTGIAPGSSRALQSCCPFASDAPSTQVTEHFSTTSAVPSSWARNLTQESADGQVCHPRGATDQLHTSGLRSLVLQQHWYK